METNMGDAKAHEPQTGSEGNIEPHGLNVQQTTNFLLDELVELEDANNLIEEMLRNEELEETPFIENGLTPNDPSAFKLPTVNFSSPEKKVIVQYIENPVAECVIENFSSMNEDVVNSQKDCILASVNGYKAQEDFKDPCAVEIDIKEIGNQKVAPESSVEPVVEAKESCAINMNPSSKDQYPENMKAPKVEMPDHEETECKDSLFNVLTDTDRKTASPLLIPEHPISKDAKDMSDPPPPITSSNNSAHLDGRKLSVSLVSLKIPPEADMSDPPSALKSRTPQSFEDEESQSKSPEQMLKEDLCASQSKSENQSTELGLSFIAEKKSPSTQNKPSEDMFSSDEEEDSPELKRMKQTVLKSSLFSEKTTVPSLDSEVLKKHGFSQCCVILEQIKVPSHTLDLFLAKRSRSKSLSSSGSSPVRFVSRTPSNSSRSRSPSVSRKRRRILSVSSRSSKSRSPPPKSKKPTVKNLDSDSEAEKLPKPDTPENDANKRHENLAESKPKLPKYSDSSRPNDKHKRHEDLRKHHDIHKSSKKKDKKRERDREHDKHRKVEPKTIVIEKKCFKKELLEKSPQLKNFLNGILIEIGRGSLDFLKPMINKHSLVDLAKFEETIMKAVKVIERTGKFYGGGVDSRPKVAPVPNKFLEKLGRRICTVLLVDCRNHPEHKNLFEKARQSYSLNASRRKAVLSEGLKTLKKMIATKTEDKTSRKSSEEKIDKVGKSFKIPKKNEVSPKDAKKPDHERKPHRSDSYNYVYKKHQSTSNKKSLEDNLCSNKPSFDFGSVMHGMNKMMKVDNLKKRDSETLNRKRKEDPDLEKILSTQVVDKRGIEINAYTTRFEGNQRIFKCWACSLSADSKDRFLKHLATDTHLSNFKSFSSHCSTTTRALSPAPYCSISKSLQNSSESKESRNASNRNTFEKSLSNSNSKRTLPEPQRDVQRVDIKMTTPSNFHRKSPSPEPMEFSGFDNDVDDDDEDDDEDFQLPFYLGLLLPEPKPLLRVPICNPKPPDSPNNEALMAIQSNIVSDETTSHTNSTSCENSSPMGKLSAKDLGLLPKPMSAIDRVENYRKEQSPPPEISSSPYSPGGSMTPPSPVVSKKRSGKNTSSTKTLNDSGFRINPHDSFVGVIKPSKVQEKSEKNSVTPKKATINVKKPSELLEGKEKKKSDASLVETVLTKLRVALETRISKDSLEGPKGSCVKNEESLANADILRANEKLSELTSQGYDNVSQDDFSSFVNKYRQVMAPLPGAPPLPVEEEKLSSALAKVRAKKAAQMSVLAKEAPSIALRQEDSNPPFPSSHIPLAQSQFPYAPPNQPQSFQFLETHQQPHKTLLPVPSPFNPIGNHPFAQRGPFSSQVSDGSPFDVSNPSKSVGPMALNTASSLQPSSQSVNFHTLPPSSNINSLEGEAKLSWEINPVSVGQQTFAGSMVHNGDELNHLYVMEIYREWGFVHDIGGWDGIILDYSKRCEEANGGPDSVGLIFQNQKYNEKIRSQDGQVLPAYSYNSSTQTFTCHICTVSINGKNNFDNHLSGRKHTTKESSLRDFIVKAEEYIPPRPLIQPLLNKFDKSPLIGLEYIVEVLHPPLKPSYRCLMCTSVLESTDVVPHLADVKHKLAYLKAFFPEIFDMFNKFPDLSFWRKPTMDMLTSVIRTIENQYGRLTPQVATSLENFESNKNIMLEAINAGPHFRPLPDLDLSFLKDPFAAYRSSLLPEYLIADRPSFPGKPGFSRR